MRRTLISIIIILNLVLSLSGTFWTVQANNLISSAQANSPIPLPDLDQDGIPNAVESNGWYNKAGGPYITNPNIADTDQDGLIDSEEKLFNTNPTDLKNPGIAVKYESSFKTLEYYNPTDPAYLAIVKGGNQNLLTEAAVLRRGTTFKLVAVNSLAATLTISGPGLTALTPVRDPARGGWTVTLPAGGTVGAYTAKITEGAWSKSMPIYVIFELPTDLTQAQINTYLYDDNPANKRDEVAVWWRAIDWKYYNNDSETPTPCNPADPICSNWQYHTVSVYAQSFWTEQYTKKVLKDYSIPAINGINNMYDATLAISKQADNSVRVNFSSVKNSFSSATKYQYFPDDPAHQATPYRMDGGACETSAGVYTAMLRSAGIASRPFAMDYNKTVGHGENGNFSIFEYDTAVMIWLKGPGDATKRWYAERTFNGEEPEWQSSPNWTSGTAGLHLLSAVGVYNPAHPELEFKHFQDTYADAIHSANDGWDFQTSEGVGMVNTTWTGTDVPGTEFVFQNRDLKWNSQKPLQIQQSPSVDILNCQVWKGDGWAPSEWYAPSDSRYASNPMGRTEIQTYLLPSGIPSSPTDIENWRYNPQPTSCSWSTSESACTAFMNAWQAACAALPGQNITNEPAPVFRPDQPASTTLNTTMQLGNILSTAGLDQNGDGRFDQLVVMVELTSSQAGEYQLGGLLSGGGKQLRANISPVTLVSGLQTVEITFDGQQIGDNKIDGPYQVEAIWAAPIDQVVSELALPEEMTAYQTYSYTSQPYQASAFTVQAASVAGNYSHFGKDLNADGLLDSITISVPLSIAMPGTFKVEADLYDGQGGFVGHSEWTGSDPTVSLEYAIAGTLPPYSLEHLNLMDASGKPLESFYAPVYQITTEVLFRNPGGEIDQSESGLITGEELSPLSITPTNTFAVNPVDVNGNNRYDQLDISAVINVTGQGQSLWMEGLLVDAQNNPVVWGFGIPKTFNPGDNQTIHMTVDGRIIFDQLPLVGDEMFTLIAVKIFSGNQGQEAILEAEIPVTGFNTPKYSRTQIEPSTTAVNLFQDDMEAGTSKWNVNGSTQWSQTSTSWKSWTHAWKTDGSTKNGLLSLAAPLNFTNYSSLWLVFNTAYELKNGQSFNLEVSTDGTQWTILKTYTGSSAYWSTEMVDLSAYGHTANVRLRFNAQSNPGSLWLIDDVYVYGENNIYLFLPLVGRH